jgi:hypothetical protein
MGKQVTKRAWRAKSQCPTFLHMFHNKSDRIRHEKRNRLCSLPSPVVLSQVVHPLRVVGPSSVVQYPADWANSISPMTKKTYLFAAALQNDNSVGDDDSDVLMATGYSSSSSSSIEDKTCDDEASQEHEEDIPAHNFWLGFRYKTQISCPMMKWTLSDLDLIIWLSTTHQKALFLVEMQRNCLTRQLYQWIMKTFITQQSSVVRLKVTFTPTKKG